MKLYIRTCLVFLLLALPFARAWADEYSETIKVFRDAGESGTFFAKSYGYAVFPTIGKGGIGIGGAYGKGRVYAKGEYVGDTSMTQLSVGFQLGGQAYSQIIFFEDKRAFDEFTSGNFEFGAQASAVAITAGASAEATTTGASADASGGKNNATTTTMGTEFHKGMAVFTVAKGGLMYEASIGGQKFSYTPK
jgi:lipid-binding SYLF domain-containing protein